VESTLKYYERTKLLIELIEKVKTGSPRDLLERLGVTKRTVYNILDELRLNLPKCINYHTAKKFMFFQKIIDPVKVFFTDLNLH